MAAQKIGFIGLGDMGWGMTANLLAKGFEVTSCANRRRQAIDRLKEDGLIEKANPREVAEEADVVMTMVMDEAQTEAVLRGGDGALAGLRPGTFVIIMSTISPDYCQNLAAELKERRIGLIDCPVSGAPMRAKDGTLALIAGGAEDDIEACRAALEAMGTIHHCGDVGLGMVAKLANQTVFLSTQSLILEARAMARSYGMDMDQLMEVFKNGTANSATVQLWDWIVEYFPDAYPMMLKDLNISSETAKAKGVATPVLDAHLSKDWPEIAKKYQDL